ncbi:MAG: dihydrofolate reductase family protein [Caldilineaceae bacterium]|nr:dihydrofolate reductase family protein [Caldilineaceae bacterium]
MVALQGPGSPFQLLFTGELPAEPSLPANFRALYPGDWHLPAPTGRPYTYSNFAQARDGRISYNEPTAFSGGDVTGYDAHDRWLMALLRARADAVMSGDATLNLETEHLWTAEFMCPADGAAFAELREAEGYAPVPIFVIVSMEGQINFDALCFRQSALQIVLATTERGAAQVQGAPCAATLDVHTLGEHSVDLPRLSQILASDYGVRNLLCEGGARLFGSMLDAQLIDEEFVTFCPNFIGRSPEKFRPSYTEGVAWQPNTAPYSQPFSLHRAGDFLYMRTKVLYKG